MGDSKLPEWATPEFMAHAHGAFGGAADFSQVLGPRAAQAFPGPDFPAPPSNAPELVHYGLANGEIEVTGTGGDYPATCCARFKPGQPARVMSSGVGNDAFAAAVAAYRTKHGF